MRYVTPRLRQAAAAILAHEAGVLAAGFQLHLRKPVDPSEIVLAVASLSRR